MLHAVTRDERDAVLADRPDDRRRRGRPVRRVDLDGLGVLEQRVQPRPADDPDLRPRHEEDDSLALEEVDPPSEPFEDPPSDPFEEPPWEPADESPDPLDEPSEVFEPPSDEDEDPPSPS